VFRIGGDEFAVIMTRVDSSIQSQVIEKINRINEALLLGDGEIPPASLSVGVAFADRKHPEGDVFMDADTALTRQKEKGRPGCEIF
jgi:diguanylate cyclase (GGDEF)-like protein